MIETGDFEVPVYAAVEQVRGGKLVPAYSDEGERLSLKDRDSGTEFGLLRVPAGQSLSNRVPVPISPKTSYQLVAADGNGLELGPIPLSWSRNGPRLRLAATPAEQSAPAADVGATVGVYMTYQGRSAVPGQPIPVSIRAPGSVRVDSPSPLTIKAGTRIADGPLSSSRSVEDATITFSEPSYATSCTVRVRFTIPWTYYALAFVCGGFSVLIARRQDLAAMWWWVMAVEVLIGGVVAVALYLAVLSAWVRSTTGSRLGLDVTTAMLIGLAGGLLGLMIFDLVIGAIRTSFEARVRSGGQAPPASDRP